MNVHTESPGTIERPPEASEVSEASATSVEAGAPEASGTSVAAEAPEKDGTPGVSETPGHRRGSYSRIERWALGAVALLGLLGINGAFVYGMLHPEVHRAALENPVSVAFIAEAFVLLAVLAYLLPKWGVTGLGRARFVALALLGSLAFALPVALLWPGTRKNLNPHTEERPR